MLEWLPKLSGPDVAVLLLTIGLCLSASRVGQVGDLVGHLIARLRAAAPADKK